MQPNKLKHIFNWRFYVEALVLPSNIIRFMHGSPFILARKRDNKVADRRPWLQIPAPSSHLPVPSARFSVPSPQFAVRRSPVRSSQFTVRTTFKYLRVRRHFPCRAEHGQCNKLLNQSIKLRVESCEQCEYS